MNTLFASLSVIGQTSNKADSGSYTLHTERIQSEVLNEERTVTVQLPKSYDKNPDKKYPVIYRLDGATNLVMMNAVLESLQAQSAAPEVIIVAIENTERLRDLYPTVNRDPNGPVGIGGGGANFLNFITTELMPVIESKYRVHDFRVIAGASAAGVFSLYAVQKNPALFDAALAYSPAVWWNYGATGKTTVAFLKNATALDHFIYTAIGNEAAPMRSYYDNMIVGIKENQPKGLRWVNETFENVPHNLVSSAAGFSAYHNLFYSEFMQPHHYDGSLSSIEEYYKNVSNQRGEHIEAAEWIIRELGYYYVNQQNFEEATKLFKYGIEHYPNSPDAYNGLAYGYEQSGQYRKSLEQVNKALSLASEDYDGYGVYVARKDRLTKLLQK
ncbi:alpha/beta hydrolase-fold protein [Alteromonas sp. ASW11-130]|uniref:alpha/beta hydrolase-fold protein n=1 Tax=Alteromonas sp. ASW11-130 TaxID=3015775 RepID=UPI002241B3BD|nr:alpha/beta hydrolase-fold protein [Alteromonas sp. ASW11-130]